MKIELKEIPIRDIASGYSNDEDTGQVVGYGGKLDIRPPFQREYCYKDKDRDAVLESVKAGFPLNVMYWSDAGDGTYELMDGQQRTISFCDYVAGKFSLGYQYFFNLTPEEQEAILDYPCMVYVCQGTYKEKLDWFKVINKQGEPLTEQELLNAIHVGPWLADAKKYFSKPKGPADQIAGDYVSGSPIRQDYLETALKWICDRDGMAVQQYMADHQRDKTAYELWSYFRSAIEWAQSLFGGHYRKKLMKGLPWGLYFNKYGKNQYDPEALETRMAELIDDEDVTNQKGIYEYLLSGETNEKCLHIRAFSDKDKQRKYQEQGGVCPMCGQHFECGEMDGDHILPWALGGKTEYGNLQMLCIKCNRGGN